MILHVHYGLCLILNILIHINIWLIKCGIYSLANILLIKLCGQISETIILSSKLGIDLEIGNINITVLKV